MDQPITNLFGNLYDMNLTRNIFVSDMKTEAKSVFQLML